MPSKKVIRNTAARAPVVAVKQTNPPGSGRAGAVTTKVIYNPHARALKGS